MSSYKHVATRGISTPSVQVNATQKTYQGSGHAGAIETVPDGSTDLEILVAVDVSAIVSVVLYSDQAVTVEVNDGTTPSETIVLKAGVPYVWNSDSYDTNQLATDIDSIFVTNASGESATVIIDAIVDATP